MGGGGGGYGRPMMPGVRERRPDCGSEVTSRQGEVRGRHGAGQSEGRHPRHDQTRGCLSASSSMSWFRDWVSDVPCTLSLE